MTYANDQPDELATYLGDSNIDQTRAALLLRLAESLAESIVAPLPDGAESVVLSASSRAYTNPEGLTSETIGPFNYQRPNGNVYLTREERRTLRRLAGGGGAFSIDMLANYVTPDWVPTDGTA